MWHMVVFGHEFYYIFYIFFLYCFFGWIYESCFVSIKSRSIVNRGFLNGPVIPIYGGGALLIYMVLWDYRNNIILVFFAGVFITTVLEYITSLVMEMLFHMRWWDYSKWHFNFQGRICLAASLLWGVLSILLLLVFQPVIDYCIASIPRKIGEIVGYAVFVLFLTDIAITAVYTVKFDQLLCKMQRLRQDMQDYLFSGKFFEAGEELMGKVSNARISSIFLEAKAIFESKLHSAKTYRQYSRLEVKQQIPEKEAKMREFFRRYQSLKTKKVHVRLIKAFPTLKVGRREAAFNDVKERILKKGVRELGRELKEDVTGKIKTNLSGILRAVMIALLVLAQFVLIIYLSFLLRGNTVYIYSFIQVLSIIIIIVLVNDNRNSSYKISWICIIAAFPITGHIMFMLWGNRRARKIELGIIKKMQHGAQYYEYNPIAVKKFMEKHPTKSRMTRYLELNGFPLYKNNSIEYYPMGDDAFEAIFKEINKAEKFIFMNFFIVGEGLLWNRLHSILQRKINDGIKVMFMYDDFGAMLRTPKNFKKNLENEGFEIRIFNPMLRYTDKLYMNYRSHQKIIVVDGNVGFTGGMNLADEYVNLVPRFGIWKDNAVRVEGDAVWGLTVTFLQMWEVSSEEEGIDYNLYRPTKKFEENDVFCQVISDGPANNPRNPVESIYKQMIYYAKKILYITTPYLIIEDDMREALITAAASGIDVRIITPAVPDKKNVKLLTNYNYGRLLEAGVRIFEYTPGFIHAKTIISEDTGIVGTINMDYRSFYLHYECGVWVCNQQVIDNIRQDLVKTMEQSHEVTLEEWKNRPFSTKVYQMVLNLFSTLM
jgi:cardiolipin synthase